MELIKNLTYVISVVIPGIGAIIGAFFGVRKWIDFESNRLFDKYSKISDFAFKLHDKNKNTDLYALGEAYGVAAFTGDTSLSLVQRKRILSSKDPVGDIQKYKMCRALVSVSEQGCHLFNWKKSKYTSNKYREGIVKVYYTLYILSFSPVLIVASLRFALPNSILAKVREQPLSYTMIITSIFCLPWIIFGCIALVKGLKIRIAERLIEENMQLRDPEAERQTQPTGL